MRYSLPRTIAVACPILLLAAAYCTADESTLPRARIDGTGAGWRALGEEDFVNVNCHPDTWSWKEGVLHCTGQPTGVLRTTKPVTNFELVAQWQHLRSAGNSGVFVWATEESLNSL